MPPAVYLIVLVPQFLGEQIGDGADQAGVIHHPAAQETFPTMHYQ